MRKKGPLSAAEGALRNMRPQTRNNGRSMPASINLPGEKCLSHPCRAVQEEAARRPLQARPATTATTTIATGSAALLSPCLLYTSDAADE